MRRAVLLEWLEMREGSVSSEGAIDFLKSFLLHIRPIKNKEICNKWEWPEIFGLTIY